MQKRIRIASLDKSAMHFGMVFESKSVWADISLLTVRRRLYWDAKGSGPGSSRPSDKWFSKWENVRLDALWLPWLTEAVERRGVPRASAWSSCRPLREIQSWASRVWFSSALAFDGKWVYFKLYSYNLLDPSAYGKWFKTDFCESQEVKRVRGALQVRQTGL